MYQLFFILIIGLLVFDYLLERLLDYLNSTRWSDQLPKELEGIYDAEKYKKSQEYEKVKHRFSLITSSFSFLLMLLVLSIGLLGTIDQWLRQYTESSIVLALLFFGIIGFVMDILQTPFSIYSTFVIENKFGFNKTTPKIFILDKLKGLLLAVIIGGGLLVIIIKIYELSGNMFWIYTWIVLSAFMIFMVMFYSNIIVPLFNKQAPLEAGELRTAIEAFAEKTGFKLDNVFVIDGSKRSSKANAYFSGLGSKKRIVLYDTLIKEHTVDELIAVLAHEIGHYKKKHTLTGVVISILQTGLMLFILSLFIQKDSSLSIAICNALGGKVSSFHLGILAFGMLYSPISLILGLIMNIVSRKNEFAADRFAAENFNSDSLQTALIKLSVNHLSNLRPHPVYVFFYYSHPPLLARLEALKNVTVKK